MKIKTTKKEVKSLHLRTNSLSKIENLFKQHSLTSRLITFDLTLRFILQLWIAASFIGFCLSLQLIKN